jgi:hypothetical protein
MCLIIGETFPSLVPLCVKTAQEPLRKLICVVPIKKLHGLSPKANYTDRATAACRRSDCQLLRI